MQQFLISLFSNKRMHCVIKCTKHLTNKIDGFRFQDNDAMI